MKDSRERGAAMVEFALITPLLVLIILGLLEFGYRYERSARLNNAAFIAAREIAIHKTGYDAAARNADPDMPGAATIVPSYSVSAACTSGNVTVTITSSEKSPTKFFPPGQLNFPVVAKGVARCDG